MQEAHKETAGMAMMTITLIVVVEIIVGFIAHFNSQEIGLVICKRAPNHRCNHLVVVKGRAMLSFRLLCFWLSLLNRNRVTLSKTLHRRSHSSLILFETFSVENWTFFFHEIIDIELGCLVWTVHSVHSALEGWRLQIYNGVHIGFSLKRGVPHNSQYHTFETFLVHFFLTHLGEPIS